MAMYVIIQDYVKMDAFEENGDKNAILIAIKAAQNAIREIGNVWIAQMTHSQMVAQNIVAYNAK
jgi:hypothetical protein